MITRTFKIIVILSQILIGGLLTIIYKLQNSIYVYEGPFYKQNFHPYIQTLTMFIGQLICLPIFFFLKWKYPQDYKNRQGESIKQGKKLGMNRLWLIVPAMCDLITATLRFIALNYVSTSAYQMVNGGTIVTCFIFSIFFLGQPLKKNQLLGSFLAVVGIVIVGFANIIHSQSQEDNNSGIMQVVGYFLLIISLFSSGFLFSFQQKLLNNYHLQPLQVVGYEGAFGLITYIMITLVLSFVPCNFGLDACVYDSQGYAYMQVWSSYFSQILDNKLLLFLTFCWIFNVTAYNPLGVTITKNINAISRAISDVSQTILVWIIGVIVTLTMGKIYPNFMWQKLDTLIIILQIIGFIFLVFGNLVYNQLIKYKFLTNRDQIQTDKSYISSNNYSSKRLLEVQKQ